MGNAYTSRLIPTRHEFKTESIADGDYDLVVPERSPSPNNIVEYVYCVDASGDPVAATGGTFTFQGSPDDGKTFDNLQDNTLSANSAISATRSKPSGRGTLTVLRVTTSGLTAAGAVGFVVGLTQHV